MVASGLLALGAASCGSDGSEPAADPPLKLDGTPSQEFEQDDIDAARDASDAVKDYCSDAVSEAQRIGCESHVDESDIP